jgi:hypothetical protein
VKTLRVKMESEPVDLLADWKSALGMAGLTVKMLSDDMDEEKRTGARTKLVQFAPGAFVTKILCHDYWEESYLLTGVIALDCDDTGLGGVPLAAPLYSCRPPGTLHGRMASPTGCLLLELQYYVR